VLAKEVAAQLLVLAEERGVDLDVSGLAVPTLIDADAVMLRQAVINVLDNAIKFTRPGTRVTLRTLVTGDLRQLIVDDEGPGIPVAERERVFERFYRVHDPHRSSGTGAGLGLAIVHWAVIANGGTLSLDESPAGGVRVIMAFPSI